jgi:hypothetical protein
MSKTIQKPGLSLTFILAAVILLGPFGVAAFFNAPASDDFLYAKFQQESGTIGANLACYFGWGGRYVSNLLLTVANPLSYSTDASVFLLPYQFHSIFLLVLLLTSFSLFTRRILNRIPDTFPFALLTLGLLLFFLTDINELLYWMAGSYTYCFGLSFGIMALYYLLEPEEINPNPSSFRFSRILMLVSGLLLTAMAAAFVFRKSLSDFLNPHPELFLIGVVGISLICVFLPLLLKGKRISPPKKYLLILICSFLSIGSNEIYAFILLPFFGVWALFGIWKEKRIKPVQGVLIFLGAVFAALNLLAPSTFARRNLQTNSTPAFDFSDPDTAWGLFSYFGFLPSIALILLSLYSFWSDGQIRKTDSRPEISDKAALGSGVLILGYLLVALPVGLTLLAGPLPDRAKNPLAFFSVLVLMALIPILTSGFPLIRKSRWVFLGLGLLLSWFHFQSPDRYSTWAEAMKFLTNGDAQKSLALHKERFRSINSCTSDTCYISKNPYQPTRLFSIESATLEEDPASWKNYKSFSYAAYFGKKSIIAR